LDDVTSGRQALAAAGEVPLLLWPVALYKPLISFGFGPYFLSIPLFTPQGPTGDSSRDGAIFFFGTFFCGPTRSCCLAGRSFDHVTSCTTFPDIPNVFARCSAGVEVVVCWPP